ncbi:MAG TPA: AAA family ATPase [Gaiellaceae bacterium]|nr:AAA family ATPase [Gaiellaceae bacterium]
MKSSLTLVLVVAAALSLGVRGAFAGAAVAQKQSTKPSTTLSYSGLLNAIDTNEVASARISGDSTRTQINVVLHDGTTRVSSYLPSDTLVQQHLIAHDVPVSVAGPPRSSVWLRLVPPLALLLVVLLAAAVILLRRGGWRRARNRRGGPSAETARTYTSTVLFRDVAGCDEAIDEVREMVEFLREPERFARVGARIPSSVLLYGPPGTGKTLIAKALAGEAAVPFFAVSGSEFIEMYVGVGAKRVRELFARARRCEGGAVIFFDEIDAIGRHRASGAVSGANDEREQTLNQLLVELDGFDTSTKVVVVAATNRIDILDKALLRPGRFGRQVPVDLPAKEGREAILEVHAKGKPLADGVDLSLLAESTAGLSGADLAEVVNEGAILAARANQTVITHRNLHDAVLRVLLGPEKRNAILAEGELEIIAYHEAGHALAAELCPNHDKPLHATVRPRGRAGGFVYMGRADRLLEDADLIHERMVVALAGRAAEQISFGKVSSGAANDLEQVNGIARQAVEKLGLSPEVGQIISFNDRSQLSQEALGRVDRVVEQFVHAAYEDALQLLSEHVESLRRLAELLITQQDLERVDILSAISSATASVRLQSRLGTRVEKVVRSDEAAAGPAPEREPARVIRPLRNTGGFRWRLRSRAAVATVTRSQP